MPAPKGAAREMARKVVKAVAAMVGKRSAGPAHVGGILGEKRRGDLGQALHGNIRNDKDQDQQGKPGKGPEENLYQALAEMGIESH